LRLAAGEAGLGQTRRLAAIRAAAVAVLLMEANEGLCEAELLEMSAARSRSGSVDFGIFIF